MGLLSWVLVLQYGWKYAFHEDGVDVVLLVSLEQDEIAVIKMSKYR